MKYKINTTQIEGLKKVLQNLIDVGLENIRSESEEWGLGEMDELFEIDSIEKIEIDRIESKRKIKVYVNIHRKAPRSDFDNTLSQIEYEMNRWFPNIKLIENKIIDTKNFGPGIDW